MRNTEDTFPDVSPFAGITYYCVRALLAPLLVMSCIDMHLFALYSLFLPLFSLVDYETNAAAGAPVDYVVDDPYLREQPGKPPIDHQISPTLLSTACIRVV